jgi:hypothetical protein
LRRERVGWFREIAAKTLQERPGLTERIANRACLAKLKRHHRDRVERRRRRGEARRMSLLFGLDFQKVPPTPTSKINLKGRVVV